MATTNFFVLEDYKLISLGIPKCGQTSVKRAFLGDVENAHDKRLLPYFKSSELEEKIADYKAKGFITFTFVRNPYDRLLSFWVQKILKPNKFTAGAGRFYQGMNFPETVRNIRQVPDELADIHYRSQTGQIMINGELPDFIGRVESFQKDWKELEEAIGKPLPALPWENKTGSKKYERELSDTRLRSLIYEHYKRDFELLGYDK